LVIEHRQQSCDTEHHVPHRGSLEAAQDTVSPSQPSRSRSASSCFAVVLVESAVHPHRFASETPLMTVTLHIATIVTQANVVIAEVLVTTHFTITIIIISIVWVESQQVFQPCGMR
jgi:hypothetical protein